MSKQAKSGAVVVPVLGDVRQHAADELIKLEELYRKAAANLVHGWIIRRAAADYHQSVLAEQARRAKEVARG
jgi:hypothetical protein